MPRNNKDSFHKRFSALLPYLWPALAVAAGLYLLLAPSQPTTVADSSVQAASDRSEIEQVTLSREVTLHATRNIEDIRVGDRVLAANPEITEEERANWGEPDWTDWQHVELEMTQADGGVLHVSMIRPREWFSLNRVEQGAEIFLVLPEMGAQGPAQVVSISACPRIRSGLGQVVTATFAHPPSTTVLDVRFEGDSQPIGVTDNHLFWSADREEFIAIGQMEIGERVLTYSGETKRIAQKLPRPGPQLVYNLEVYGEHVYFVGELGLLAHNMYGDDLGDFGDFSPGRTGFIKGAAEARQQVRPGQLAEVPHAVSGGRPGHVKSSHGWDVNDTRVVDIRNNPDKIYISTNSKNPVTIFWKDGDVVITETADSTLLRTAYGKSAPKRPSYKPDVWADDPDFLLVE